MRRRCKVGKGEQTLLEVWREGNALPSHGEPKQVPNLKDGVQQDILQTIVWITSQGVWAETRRTNQCS
jgi:hypothetical protein